MAELTSEEDDVLRKPQDQVVWSDRKILQSACRKLVGSEESEDYFLANLRLAVAIERTTRPHFEKAKLWEIAAGIAELQSKRSSKLFEIAAEYNARDSAHGSAANLYEKAADRGIEEEWGPKYVQDCLRNSRRMYDLSGRSTDAGRIYIREKNFMLETAKWPSKAWLLVFKTISAYGESPLRVAMVATIVILICSSIYWFTGLTSNVLNELIHSASTSLYFSVVTFSTLGYGDYSPPPGLARLTATFEALSGLFLMSLFLVTLVRQFGRS